MLGHRVMVKSHFYDELEILKNSVSIVKRRFYNSNHHNYV